MLGAVAAIAVGAVGGLAYASVTSNGVISACAKKENGQLRLDGGSGCRSSEQPVQWNQTGPPGPSGLSESDERTFARRLSDVSTWQPVGKSRADMTHLVSLHLNQGDYLVQAQVIGGDFTGTGTLVCIAGNSALGGFAVGQGSVGNTGGYVNQVNLSFQSTFAVPSGGGDIDLSCWLAPDGDGGQPLVGLGDVIATKVDSLN
jgi:hypothetical protein